MKYDVEITLTSLPILLLQHNIPHILIDVDFSKGEANLPEAIRKHPHREVPILIDGDFVIFEA